MSSLKKRGIVWGNLAYALIGVIVIISMAAIFTGPLVQRNPVLAKVLGFVLPTYIEPEQGITVNQYKASEHITVANSMKSTACAINSVAEGSLGKNNRNLCDKEYLASQDGIKQL